MRLISDPSRFQRWCFSRKSLGLVPTMGALHPGHLSLVRRAKRECRNVAVSIFVNPAQFGPREDFGRYPRNLAADLKMLRPLKVDAVFAPAAAKMYPPGSSSAVTVGGLLGRDLEARIRPGHFQGVATVVAKLFGLARPLRAYFGRKDFQQLLVVKRLASDLNLGVKIVACATEREADGLARSSRNRFLGPEERRRSVFLFKTLRHIAGALKGGTSAATALKGGLKMLRQNGISRVDYLEYRDAETLDKVQRKKKAVLLAAVRLGNVRLIDNLELAGGVEAAGRKK